MLHGQGTLQRPVCKYGAQCFRKNPQHLRDFAHPPEGRPIFSEAVRRQREPAPLLSKASKQQRAFHSEGRSQAARGRHCKFGCGRPVNADAHRIYDTCCRRCALCQGGGEHEPGCLGAAAAESVQAPVSKGSEAAALMAVDCALELRQRARSFERHGDHAAAQQLLRDSAEQLERARVMLSEWKAMGSRSSSGSGNAKLTQLLDDILMAWRQSDSAASSNAWFEKAEPWAGKVDEELDRLIEQLEGCLQGRASPAVPRQLPTETMDNRGYTRDARALPTATVSLAKLCRFGCGRACNAGPAKGGGDFTTCCRTCAIQKGSGKHDPDCDAAQAASNLELAPACADLVPASAAIHGFRHPSSDEQAPPPPPAPFALPAQLALRVLSLDDEWPTSLTLREIRRRYMCKALACHPDKGPPAEKAWRTESFQALSDAYATLEAQMAVLERIRGLTSETVEVQPAAEPPPKDHQTGEHQALCDGRAALPESPAAAPLPAQRSAALPSPARVDASSSLPPPPLPPPMEPPETAASFEAMATVTTIIQPRRPEVLPAAIPEEAPSRHAGCQTPPGDGQAPAASSSFDLASWFGSIFSSHCSSLSTAGKHERIS
eukprot:TRINITY_DN20073_c0_g1_i1.p1 TRINITY_DN20073_c0_g1~~TRINITY_DN20073_c0_g1_i1.p1  ORF type:complete len:623 (+),score=112.46 TRINITY_DN20073_c0_g1_i1:57-1871(+)